MNKSSSLLLQLYFHLLHFLIVNKSSYFKKKKKKEKRKKKKEKRKKKKKKEIFKKDLRTRGIGLVFLRLLSKKKKKIINQNFQFFEKIQDFQNLKKKIFNFQFLRKIKVFQIKKKKKSLLNSTSGTKSYDPLPRSPVMQHQVNYPPSAFIELSTRIR